MIVFFFKQKTAYEMRISDWSSDVCSSDLFENLNELVPQLLAQDYPEFEVIVVNDRSNDQTFDYLLEATQQHPRLRMVNVKDTPERVNGKKYGITLDRKSVGWGKSVSVRVDIGDRRIIKKKKKKNKK